jgi:Papain family cysteine protease
MHVWRKPSDTLLPAAISLISGQTPVTDQGFRPTCAAMAATAAHEFGRGGITLSVEHLWANVAARGGVVPSGARLSVVRTAVVIDGQCEESLWPYHGDTPTPAPRSMPSAVYKADPASALSVLSLDVVRTELAGNRPPVLVINPNAAFGLGLSPIGATTADQADGFLHAVLAVGYDDDSSILTVRNSWGSSWGRSGYADLTYDFITLRGRVVMTVVV